jgi:hypothetical protein
MEGGLRHFSHCFVDVAMTKAKKTCSIGTDVRCAAPSRELLWIDEHLFDGNPLRNEFFKALVGRAKPFFEGVAQLRFVRDEVTDRLVVLGGECPPPTSCSAQVMIAHT